MMSDVPDIDLLLADYYNTNNSTVDYATLKEQLNNKIFGQSDIIESVVNTILISAADIGNDEKPQGSFLFTGPTGTGKTELAKELAKQLKKDFIRLDMSEYADEYSARNLTGGQKGLVGYEDGGLLTNEVKEKPNSVILFDEIEKADPAVYKVFLQILDYATLTDTQGQEVDFSKTVIIMTSNLGVQTTRENRVGFKNEVDDDSLNYKAIVDFFTPEMRARIDKILYFNPITDEIIHNIIEKFLKEFEYELEKKHIDLTVTENAREKLHDIWGESEQEGARTISKIINNHFKQHIAKEILFGHLMDGGNIEIDVKDDEFIYNYPHVYFQTSQEACQYARENVGAIITLAEDGIGYILKGYEEIQ